MFALFFALKRLLIKPWFPLFVLLILFIPPMAQRAAAEVAVPSPAYAVTETADEDAARMAAYLEEAGFVRFSSREALEEAVANGKADAGVVIPGNISPILHSDDIKGCLFFVKSPNSLLPDLWQEHASAALFGVYAPYIMADALEGSELSEEEILSAFRARMDGGKLFSFEIKSAKGQVVPLSERQLRFFLGALSLLLFAAAFYAAGEPLISETRKLSARTGKRKALLSFFLPGVLIRYGLLALAGVCAALLCGRKELLIPVLLYVLLLALLTLLLKSLPGREWQGILCLFILLASLALCPVYNDLSLSVPAVSVIRCFLPPYWLFMLAA